uniref:Polygalacturonase n=1 Tax=Triticum urartu TaxID=4572 RepID=A0A8R7QJT2_TRIUA
MWHDHGARIKTWQGRSGFAKNITFQNMIMDNVQNPIIIDQNYCDRETMQESSVEVNNVTFKNIRGTTIFKEAIKVSCSTNVLCSQIALGNIHLNFEG